MLDAGTIMTGGVYERAFVNYRPSCAFRYGPTRPYNPGRHIYERTFVCH